MGNLTKNLSRHEFACECGCGFDTADFDLVNALQNCVDHFTGCYVVISGPNRCATHNKTVGGADNSMHQFGKAADFKLYTLKTREQIDPSLVYDYLDDKYSNRCGIGIYHNRVHFDVRSEFARWEVS